MGWFRKDDDQGPLGALSSDAATYQPAPVAPALPAGDAILVEVTDPGPKRIQVIKVHREATGLGLRESKDAVESPPTSFGVHPPAEAARLRDALTGFGATVRLDGEGAAQPQLDYLTDLLDRGVVTPEAYAAERRRLLG